MINYINIPTSILLTAGASPVINNDYAQYGFLGILLSMLMWYTITTIKQANKQKIDDDRKEAEAVIRHANEIKEINDRNDRSIEKEKERYHDLHKEILIILKANTNG